MSGNLVSATLRGGLFTRIVGKRLLFFQEIVSTMNEATQQAKSGADEGTVVIAEVQTAGRGRQGRSWISREGNLYLSILFRPTLDALPMIGILAGVATVRAIRTTTGSDPRIKWPNDVMLGGKKICGILVESVVQGDTVAFAVLGIGININLDTESLEDIGDFAGSLNAAVGHPVSREDLLRQLLHNLDGLYLQAMQGQSPLPKWRTMLETLGQRVRARGSSESYIGLAEDVDELGNLQLRLDSGQMITLTAGDISLSHDKQ